jgi:hypothetical protein
MSTEDDSHRQIKYHHLDVVKFSILNGGLHSFINFLTYPSDLLRTRMQLQSTRMQDHKMKNFYPFYNSTWNGFRTILKTEGSRGLFKGFLFSEFGWFTSYTIQYACYEFVKETVQGFFNPKSTMGVFVTTFSSGAIASLFALFITIPTEVIQQRLQIQGSLMAKPMYRGGFHAFKKIYKEDGIQGLYRGSLMTIARDVTWMATWWGSYELFKYLLRHVNVRKYMGIEQRDYTAKISNEDPVNQFIAGVCAALITTFIITPIEIVKTQAQTLHMHKQVASHLSISGIYMQMIRKEGIFFSMERPYSLNINECPQLRCRCSNI